VSDAEDQAAASGAGEAVVVRRSTRARKMALRVFPHGVVEVVVPLRTGQRTIDQFVLSNAQWIAKTRGRFRALVGDAGFAPPANIALAAIGERWEVRYAPGRPRLSVQPAPGGGRLSLAGPEDPQWRRQRLRSWLMERGRECLVPWLTEVSAEAGLEYAGATVRRQRSRWGSCTARKTISLNCALLFLEPALVRHLFLHELAHTRHLNHSPAFWRLVAALDPEFETREKQLRGAWYDVPAWVSYDQSK
jgi:predicted metal-dependent hydrolase